MTWIVKCRDFTLDVQNYTIKTSAQKACVEMSPCTLNNNLDRLGYHVHLNFVQTINQKTGNMLSLRLWIPSPSREPATWRDLLPVFTIQYCPLICAAVLSGKCRQHCHQRLPWSCRFSTAEQYPEF